MRWQRAAGAWIDDERLCVREVLNAWGSVTDVGAGPDYPTTTVDSLHAAVDAWRFRQARRR